MRGAAAAFAIWGAAFSPPTFAQAQTSSVAQSSQVAALGERSAQALGLQQDVSGAYGQLLTRIGEARALAQQHVPADVVKKWSDGWTGPFHANFAALETRASALTADTPQAQAALAPFNPSMRKAAMGQWSAPAHMLAALKPLVERVERQAPAAAGGDPTALRDLGQAYFDISIAAVGAETEAMRVSLEGADPTHPQTAVSECSLATNEATQAVIELQKRVALGGRIDGDAYVGRIKTAAERLRAAAVRLPDLSKTSLARFDSLLTPETQTLAPGVRAAFATYAETAEIELDIADVFVRVADNLEARGPSPGFDNAMAELGPLIARRVELQQKRNAALRG